MPGSSSAVVIGRPPAARRHQPPAVINATGPIQLPFARRWRLGSLSRRSLGLLAVLRAGCVRQQLVVEHRRAPDLRAAPAPRTTATSATAAASGHGRSASRACRSSRAPSSLPPSTTQTGAVDGIQCGADRAARLPHPRPPGRVRRRRADALPGGIGIPGSQIAADHGGAGRRGRPVHLLAAHPRPDGVIHIESPTQRIYTLGKFFDEWHQPLSADQVGDVHGQGHGVRQRQAVDEEPARDPARCRTR